MSDKQQRADGTPAPDCSASDELRRVKREIGEVMAVLEGMSMGGIGSCGPTIWELDGHILEHGQPIENNADYHTAQLAWRRLQKIIEPNTRDVGPKPAAGAGTHKSLVGGKS